MQILPTTTGELLQLVHLRQFSILRKMHDCFYEKCETVLVFEFF